MIPRSASKRPGERGFSELPGSEKGGNRLAGRGTLHVSENRPGYDPCRISTPWMIYKVQKRTIGPIPGQDLRRCVPVGNLHVQVSALFQRSAFGSAPLIQFAFSFFAPARHRSGNNSATENGDEP